MHMADALISPAVGGAMWAVSGGIMAYCARKVQDSLKDNLVPLMGVLGAFIFTAQMINFSIPGTGSSGHLGGGLLLAVLLGPYAAFLVIASVLTVQAFFFADGGLLALGCNIFNLGFYPAFIAYPFLYRLIAKERYVSSRAVVAAVAAAVAGLQLGAFSVVLETKASGISDLPFGTFVLLMLPVHLAIGAAEGLTTAVVVSFVARARPEVMPTAGSIAGSPVNLRPVLMGLLIAAAVVGGTLSWFASTHPDGLEWSLAKATGKDEFAGTESGLHKRLSAVQETTAVLPDYGFKAPEHAASAEAASAGEKSRETWPAVSAGASLSGIAGGFATLVLVCLTGWALKKRQTTV